MTHGETAQSLCLMRRSSLSPAQLPAADRQNATFLCADSPATSTTASAAGWFGIDQISDDLGTQKFEPLSTEPAELMAENMRWIDNKINQGAIIYDRGKVGNNSPYYQMELNRIKNYNNVLHVYSFYNCSQTFRLHFVWK